MNSETLFEALGTVDDRLLIEAGLPERRERRNTIKRILIVASFLVPVFLLAYNWGIVKQKNEDRYIQEEFYVANQEISILIQISSVNKEELYGRVLLDDDNDEISFDDVIQVCFSEQTVFSRADGMRENYERSDFQTVAEEYEVNDIVLVSFREYSNRAVLALQISASVSDLAYRNVENSFDITVSEGETSVLSWKKDSFLLLDRVRDIYLYNLTVSEITDITSNYFAQAELEFPSSGKYIILAAGEDYFSVLPAELFEIRQIITSKEGGIVMMGGGSIAD